MASAFGAGAGRRAGMWAADIAGNIFNGQNGIINAGRTDALAALGQGRTQGLDALGQGYGQARDDLGQQFTGAIGRLDPWTTAGQGALTAYQGSLGLGGDAARDSAVAAYRTSPGYERRVSEATDAVARKASALGALGSGNTMQAISDRANYLADEDYGRWQGQVQGVADRGQQAATTQAGLQGQYGSALAGLGQSQGRDTASLYGDTAAREAGTIGNFTGLGMGALGQFGDTLIGAGTGAMMAGQQAAQNRMNFGMNLANLGAGLAGRYMGGRAA